jgi:hypothetical protein
MQQTGRPHSRQVTDGIGHEAMHVFTLGAYR